MTVTVVFIVMECERIFGQSWTLSFASLGFYQVVPRNHMSLFFTGYVKGRAIIPRYFTLLTQ